LMSSPATASNDSSSCRYAPLPRPPFISTFISPHHASVHLLRGGGQTAPDVKSAAIFSIHTALFSWAWRGLTLPVLPRWAGGGRLYYIEQGAPASPPLKLVSPGQIAARANVVFYLWLFLHISKFLVVHILGDFEICRKPKGGRE
jgi:hypothetical protein